MAIKPVECAEKRGITKYTVEVVCAECGQSFTKEFPDGAAAIAWYSTKLNLVCEHCETMLIYNGPYRALQLGFVNNHRRRPK